MTALRLAAVLLRQSGWLLGLVLLWPIVVALLLSHFGGPLGAEDVAGALQQDAFYGLAVVAFTAASALHNERRSQRILFVLSKGVGRAEYLLGIVAAAWLFLVVYTGVTVASALWLCRQAGVDAMALPRLALLLLVLGLFVDCLEVWLSTLLHPLLATFVSALLLALSVYLAVGRGLPLLTPAGTLLASLMNLHMEPGRAGDWQVGAAVLLLTIAEACVVFGMAVWSFLHADVTASVE